MTNVEQFNQIKTACINYAKSCCDGIDVHNDIKWQEESSYVHYENIKDNMRQFEDTVRPLSVIEWGQIIDEVTDILWI